jgi:hypothetical protein
MTIASAALGLAILASAAAPLGPPPAAGTALPKGQCLISRELGRHSVVDKNTLLLRSFGRQSGTYRLTMTNGCLRNAISSDPISLQDDGAFCKPSEIVLMARGGKCAVDSIVKLSEDEVAALPRKLRP